MPEVAESLERVVGKNFSRNNVTGTRKPSDLYETPYSVTAQFLVEKPMPRAYSILEPAAGHGAIVQVLREHGYHWITDYDLVMDGTDFLNERGTYDVVLTNPPYSLAQQFILHAKRVARHRICLLLPVTYLHGKKRYDDIFMDRNFPLAEVYVFTRYIWLGDPLRDDGKYKTGMVAYAWYVWDVAHEGEPVIRWIDNHRHVIGARP